MTCKTQTRKEASGVDPLTYRTAADCSTTELYLHSIQTSFVASFEPTSEIGELVAEEP
jgi:hypothetical protein